MCRVHWDKSGPSKHDLWNIKNLGFDNKCYLFTLMAGRVVEPPLVEEEYFLD